MLLLGLLSAHLHLDYCSHSLYTWRKCLAQPVYDGDIHVRNERLTSERRWTADVTGLHLGYADLAEVPNLGNERTAGQRAVEVIHFNLIVSYNIQ